MIMWWQYETRPSVYDNVACVLHNILNNYYGLEINQTNDFRLLIDVLRDLRAFHE